MVVTDFDRLGDHGWARESIVADATDYVDELRFLAGRDSPPRLRSRRCPLPIPNDMGQTASRVSSEAGSGSSSVTREVFGKKRR